MADVVFVAVVVAFFALAALFVVACDRIIGPDELPTSVGLDRSDDRADGRSENTSENEVTV